MSKVDQRKQEYDTAQKLGESVERMCHEDGWKNYFIPTMQKKREEAQAIINAKDVTERNADFCRGMLQVLDFVLSYEEDKKKQAYTIMRKSADAAKRELL